MIDTDDVFILRHCINAQVAKNMLEHGLRPDEIAKGIQLTFEDYVRLVRFAHIGRNALHDCLVNADLSTFDTSQFSSSPMPCWEN